jgi:hypothetical protein
MPTNKDWKRLVRARMQKTGESYTAARAILLQKSAPRRAVPRARAPAPDYAALAGMSDAAVKAKTGCPWARWVAALDRVQAHTWSHREIAAWVREKYGVTGWWAQTVTVGYERIKGLRAIGQRRGGSFEANKSRTFAVPVAALFGAWHDERTRARWLGDFGLTVRKATPHRSMRITWHDGSSVELWFTEKGAAKSQVQVAQRKLPDRAAAARAKAFWAQKLDALRDVLAGGSSRRRPVPQ